MKIAWQALVLLLTTLWVLPAGARPGPLTPVLRVAMRANDFLNCLGITTHLSQGRDTEAQVMAGWTYLGVRHDRDDGTNDPNTIAAYIDLHNKVGFNMMMLPWGGDLTDTLNFLDQLASHGMLFAVEGQNEPNNQNFSYNGQLCSTGTSFLPCAQFQRDFYKAAKADPLLAQLPMFAETEPGAEPDNAGLQFLTIPAGAGTLMADGTVFADYANVHNYVRCNGCSAPFDNVAWYAEAPGLSEGSYDGLDGEFINQTWRWWKHFTAYPVSTNLPRVTTETGWATNEVTQDQQGKILTNVYLSAAERGWSYTFIYQMLDDSGDQFGVFSNTNPPTPKLAATYIHNLTSILADRSSAFAPRPLSYSIPSEPVTVHDLLMEKSNGWYELAVWNDQPTSENPSQAISVNLPQSYATVNVYDITAGTAPVATLSNSSVVPLTLTDHAMILEFGS